MKDVIIRLFEQPTVRNFHVFFFGTISGFYLLISFIAAAMVCTALWHRADEKKWTKLAKVSASLGATWWIICTVWMLVGLLGAQGIQWCLMLLLLSMGTGFTVSLILESLFTLNRYLFRHKPTPSP